MAVEDIRAPDYPPREQVNFGRVPLLESLRRNLLLALLPVVLLVGAAVAIGLQRQPEYESEARLNVGGLNLTQQSIDGYTAAVTHLAVAYARSVHATGVMRPAARELGMPERDVVRQVDATPIPGSSVVRVIATGDSAEEAVRIADAVGDSLVDYAIELNSGRSTSGGLLARFREASREFQQAQDRMRRARRGSARRRALETRVDIARLRMTTTGVLYQQSQAGQAATELIQKLAPASRAKSDREDVLQTLVAGGAIGGLLIGIGLAVARANRSARRRLGAL